MEVIDLPNEKVKKARDRLFATLTEGSPEDQQEAYRQIVETISHPMAIFRGRCVRGTKKIQYLLNMVIILRKAMYLVFLALGIFVNWLWLIGLPLWFVCNMTLLNRLQTWMNCELASRLIALDELMEEDEEFRNKTLATLGQMPK